MYCHVNLLLWTFSNFSLAQEAEPAVVEYRVASVTHKVRQKMSLDSPLRGIIYSGDVFAVGEVVGYNECSAGWAQVSGGYVCLIKTKVIDDAPIDLPTMIPFLPPLPEEEETANQSSVWNFTSPEEDYFMPTIHAKRDDQHRGRLWKSVESYEAKEGARWRLSTGRDYRFVDAYETDRGWVLERPNGSIAPLNELYVYGADRFFGRELEAHPSQPETSIAWVMNKNGAPIYWTASDESEQFIVLEYRRSVDVRPSASEGWLELPMGEEVGYIKETDLREWQPQPPPSAVTERDVWIDADLQTQMLAVYRGNEMLFVTLMSSAKSEYKTPVGLFQIYDKSTGWDLGSLEGADDAYFMERVPFVMHYAPRYAIHSAFWHDDFGHPASHGCLNISMRDAEYVFNKISPELPKGWRFVKQSRQFSGSVVRIRNGDEAVPDKRIKPR